MDETTIIQYMLGILSQIKLLHWATMKYSEHKALDELHSKLSESIDLFVESYIGRFNKQPLKKFTITTKANSDTSKVVEYLNGEYENINKMRKHFTKTSELDNIIQDMLASIDTAIYLCKLS